MTKDLITQAVKTVLFEFEKGYCTKQEAKKPA